MIVSSLAIFHVVLLYCVIIQNVGVIDKQRHDTEIYQLENEAEDECLPSMNYQSVS